MIRKMIVVCLAVAVALALSMSAFAGETIKVKGTVAKIDATAKSVTIQPNEGEPVTVVMEDADQLTKVKEGEKGQVTYEVRDGKNAGTKLKKMNDGCS